MTHNRGSIFVAAGVPPAEGLNEIVGLRVGSAELLLRIVMMTDAITVADPESALHQGVIGRG